MGWCDECPIQDECPDYCPGDICCHDDDDDEFEDY